jgi:hypothetical protein
MIATMTMLLEQILEDLDHLERVLGDAPDPLTD